MKAIILAAGVGSRLRPLTDEVPKCLVEVNNKSIIEYQIDAYLKAEVEEIIILTGYLSEKLVEFIKFRYPESNIKFINNADYENTNNMYSLYLAKEYMTGEFVMSNADVVFSLDMVQHLLSNEGVSLIAVDKDNYMEESMKIVVDNDKVTAISKQIEEKDAYGVSIDLYKFNSNACKAMVDEMNRVINVDKNLNSWTEVALNNILSIVKFSPLPIENRFWYEIDNHEDLKIAKTIVKGN